ncbi:MAG TPA: D-alanine--D-alanine ligase [Sedimentisphaerales bacterium]|nr:D-alanine--D-alanine ligase [Sedimentisphaerales bacterium]
MNSKLKTVNSKLVVSEAEPLKVAVLMGGIGEERDISIQSGNCVTQALKEAGLNVVAADIAPENLDILEDGSIDVFFIALHGKFGEDGQLQQILEDKSLVYTGSGPTASRLAFDKMAGKRAFAKAGLITPKVINFDVQTEVKDLVKQLLQLGDKFVVKPVRQGSTIGVSRADDPKSALAAARQCLSKFGDCMIEEFIPGRDITVGILCNQALPIIELRTQTGFYDYQAKYLDEKTQFLFDTIEQPALKAKVKAAALDCFNVLGCRHFARVDFRLGNDEVPYALEVNTIPGFTTRSDLPKAAAKTGLSMSDLCTKIIEAAYSSLVNRQA